MADRTCLQPYYTVLLTHKTLDILFCPTSHRDESLARYGLSISTPWYHRWASAVLASRQEFERVSDRGPRVFAGFKEATRWYSDRQPGPWIFPFRE